MNMLIGVGLAIFMTILSLIATKIYYVKVVEPNENIDENKNIKLILGKDGLESLCEHNWYYASSIASDQINNKCSKVCVKCGLMQK